MKKNTKTYISKIDFTGCLSLEEILDELNTVDIRKVTGHAYYERKNKR